METNVQNDRDKRAKELHTIDMDVQSLSALLASLDKTSSYATPAAEHRTESSDRRVDGNLDEEEEESFIEDEEGLQQLLERIYAADMLASDVEGKVDILLENLEQLLGSLDEKDPKDQPVAKDHQEETEEKDATKPEEKGDES
ncbi:hypothetical protein FRC16_011008 [Serendipita sp. 398]|nr:hypothetical protein FRC16_011008 [Serendipita sp. 398]